MARVKEAFFEDLEEDESYDPNEELLMRDQKDILIGTWDAQIALYEDNFLKIVFAPSFTPIILEIAPRDAKRIREALEQAETDMLKYYSDKASDDF